MEKWNEMREIKFRAWDTLRKRMLYSAPYINAEMTKPNEFTSVAIIMGLVKSMIPMQFIGLKDDIQKEIYEGDICIIDVGHLGKYKAVVSFSDATFFWKIKDKKWNLGQNEISWFHIASCKVIVNIYENSELLK